MKKKILGLILAASILAAGSISAYAAADSRETAYADKTAVCTGYGTCVNNTRCNFENCQKDNSVVSEGVSCQRQQSRNHDSRRAVHYQNGTGCRKGRGNR